MREEQTLPEMRAAFEEWRAKEPWYIVSVEDKDDIEHGTTHRLMNIAASTAWQAGFNAGIAEGGKDAWQPIETAPHGRKLIVGYPNKLGNWRTVMACYYGPETLDCEWNESGWADEGWYEECKSREEEIYPTDEEPTHWMPLPTPPAAMPNKDQK